MTIPVALPELPGAPGWARSETKYLSPEQKYVTCVVKISRKFEDLNKHIANIPYMRMNRLTTTFQSMVNQSKIQNVKSAKLFDCSECGNMFSSYSEQKSHNDEYHEKTRHRTTEAPYYSKYQEDAVFEALTMEEREELETLHHKEMEPTQEEEDCH